MDLTDFQRVADHALHSIESLLFEWFPNGVVEGAEFCIGNVSGKAGKSMKIHMAHDERAGWWSDFAAGEAGRDLISLYALKEGLTQGRACAALAKQFGIELTPSDRAPAQQRADSPISKSTKKLAPAPARQGVEEKLPRAGWEPVLPVPADAGPYPVAHLVRGRPEMHWEYRDQDGQLLGVVYRFKTSDGGKEVLPCVYAKNSETGETKWHWIQWREPRPLYLKGRMRPELPVLVVEGEKCVDAAFAMLNDHYDVVSWSGGGNAIKKADWQTIAGRRVVLWPDADAKRYKDSHARAGQLMDEHEQPGMKCMLKLREILQALDCFVDVIDIPEPGIKPDGWDVADMIAEGARDVDVDAFAMNRRYYKDADDAVVEDADDVPDWVQAAPLDVDESISTPQSAGAGKKIRAAIRSSMIMSRDGVKGCRENVYTAMKKDPLLIGLVSLDLFSMTMVKRRDPPWPSEPGEWNEGDDFQLGVYTARFYQLVIASVGEIEKAVAQIARENSFNLVTDMLDICKSNWDRVQRVENAFAKYWGAPASEYMSLISRMFFVGLIKRAYVPGVKHDDAPVFEGSQGEGKSTALSILGGKWFADTPFRMGDKDGFLAIQGIWIYEIAELEQFNRSEVTAVKAFMSSQTDRYREPYGRRMKNQPRRTVFGATTNEGQYFKDMTGNRRFWPVDTGLLDLEALRADREQLLGEAVHMMEAGLKWYPNREEQQRLITPVQESREIYDDWTVPIWRYLQGIDSLGDSIGIVRDKVSSYDVITKALHIEISKLSQAKSETSRVSAIMRKLGWKKERETNGAREYFYSRPKAVVPEPSEADDAPLPI